MVKPHQNKMVGREGPATLDSGDPIPGVVLMSQPRWYLIQCKARQEERALEHLELQDFECYRLLYSEQRLSFPIGGVRKLNVTRPALGSA